MNIFVKTLIAVAAIVAMHSARAGGINFPPDTPDGVKAMTLALGTRCLNSVNSYGHRVDIRVSVREAGYSDSGGQAYIATMSYDGVQGDPNCGEAVIVDNQGALTWGYGTGNGNWGVKIQDAKKFIPFDQVDQLIDQMHIRKNNLD